MTPRSYLFTFLVAGALLAVAVPTLIAYNTSPSATFYNQIAGYIAWGCFGFLTCAALPGLAAAQGSASTRAAGDGGRARASWAHAAVLAVPAVMLVAAIESHRVNGLPLGLTLQAVGMLCGAALVFFLGAWCARQGESHPGFEAFCWALGAAGLLGLAIGAMQVFKPQWADGDVLAHTIVAGRAVGNLRQPNHLSTLMLWAAAACVWLAQATPARRESRRWWVAATLCVWALCAGVVWTASRTGMVGVGLLLLWGAVDRKLSPRMRLTLCLAPVVYILVWGGMWWLEHHEGIAFASEGRLHDHSDISSSRFAIWSNTLALIRMHPWTGVGYGEFNLAWTLTPFPHRPVEFFDHTHNIVLQFVVELGLPLGLLLTALLLCGFAGLVRRAREEDGALGPAASSAALYIVALAGVHSLLEYPLWYTYFLYPAAFCWGFGLMRREPASATGAAGAPTAWAAWGMEAVNTGFVLMALSGLWAIYQYDLARRVYYVDGPHDAPLEVRVARAERSPLFDYQGAYAQATTSDDPQVVLHAVRGPLHNLIDARLMAAYARALGQTGQIDKAWYVADRLREFHHPLGDDFFNECQDYGPGDPDTPFQCLPRPPARRTFSFEDFRP